MAFVPTPTSRVVSRSRSFIEPVTAMTVQTPKSTAAPKGEPSDLERVRYCPNGLRVGLGDFSQERDGECHHPGGECDDLFRCFQCGFVDDPGWCAGSRAGPLLRPPSPQLSARTTVECPPSSRHWGCVCLEEPLGARLSVASQILVGSITQTNWVPCYRCFGCRQKESCQWR